MSVVRLFSGAVFILSEFTDISFEVETVLCFDLYAFRDVFRRSRRFEFFYNQCSQLERKRLFPRNLTFLQQFKIFFIFRLVVFFFQNGYGKVFR